MVIFVLADTHSIQKRWENRLCWLLNVHVINNFRQTEIHIAEPLTYRPHSFEVQTATEKLKGCNHQIFIKLILTGYKLIL